MTENTAHFEIGDAVMVEKGPNDLFNNDFGGTIRDIKDDIITIEDMDGDFWDCDACQVGFWED